MKLELSAEQKLQVLLTEIKERYDAAHKMRERGTRFTIWISGMAIGLAWILVQQESLTLQQRSALSALVIALTVGAGYFILGLRCGFRSNRETMIQVEDALGLFDSGVYLDDRSVLPAAYKATTGKWRHHFRILFAWLLLTAISLLALTWTCPNRAVNTPTKSPNHTQTGGR